MQLHSTWNSFFHSMLTFLDYVGWLNSKCTIFMVELIALNRWNPHILCCELKIDPSAFFIISCVNLRSSWLIYTIWSITGKGTLDNVSLWMGDHFCYKESMARLHIKNNKLIRMYTGWSKVFWKDLGQIFAQQWDTVK